MTDASKSLDVLIGELFAVARAMELVEFEAREPDLHLTSSTCRAIVKDAIATIISQRNIA